MAKKINEEKVLNNIISRSLWEPSGDPNDEQLESAADAFIFLKSRGLKVEGEQSVINVLRKDNVYDRDFLADVKVSTGIDILSASEENE